MGEAAHYFKDYLSTRLDPSLTLVHHAHLLASRGAGARAMLTRAGVTGQCYPATIVDATLECQWWSSVAYGVVLMVGTQALHAPLIQRESAAALSHLVSSAVGDVRGATMSDTSALMETAGMYMADRTSAHSAVL